MVYVVLNTMIWIIVRTTNGRVIPSNWHEKEVYSWGVTSRDAPSWVKRIAGKLMPGRFWADADDSQKGDVELVDNESVVNTVSLRAHSMEENKEVHIVESHSQGRVGARDVDLPSLN